MGRRKGAKKQKSQPPPLTDRQPLPLFSNDLWMHISTFVPQTSAPSWRLTCHKFNDIFQYTAIRIHSPNRPHHASVSRSLTEGQHLGQLQVLEWPAGAFSSSTLQQILHKAHRLKQATLSSYNNQPRRHFAHGIYLDWRLPLNDFTGGEWAKTIIDLCIGSSSVKSLTIVLPREELALCYAIGALSRSDFSLHELTIRLTDGTNIEHPRNLMTAILRHTELMLLRADIGGPEADQKELREYLQQRGIRLEANGLPT